MAPPRPAPARRKVSPVGGHVRVSGGLAKGGLGYADAIGAEAVQVFVTNPRGWALTTGNAQQDVAFRDGCGERGITAFVHSPYLVNFGSPTIGTVEQSAACVAHTLVRAREIGALGVVVHTGSAVLGGDRATALRQVRERLLPLLDAIPDDGPDLLLEPTAGQGMSLCATVDDIGPYLDALDRHPRVGICLDTCHAFAAGHDLAARGGMKRTLDALVRVAGRGRLRLVHANDSMDVVGAHKDRHEKIGKGYIGEEPFAEMFAHPALRGVPVVIETPGDVDDYARDVALLKDLRDR
jgi:deoxyribonuclease IV